MVSHWFLSDNKSRRVPRHHQSILADLNIAEIWMVSTRPINSKTSSPCTKALLIVPWTLITIAIIVTFMFQSFQFPCKALGIILLFTFFQFQSVVCRDIKVNNSASSLSFLLIRAGRLAGIRWSVCISKSQRSLCVLFCSTDSGLCI